MLSKSRLILVLMAALLPIGAASTNANASITFIPSGNQTLVSEGSITFTTEAVEVICPITLAGSLQSGSIAETSGTQIGSISTVTPGRCTNGEVRVLAETLPWRLTFGALLGSGPESFTGMEMRIVEAAMLFSVFSGLGRCLYRGSINTLVSLEEQNPYALGTVRSLENEISLFRELSGFGCPRTGRIRGTFRLQAGQGMQQGAGNNRPLQAEVQGVAIVGAGSLTFRFRNTSAADITVERARLHHTGRGITLTRNDCDGVVLRRAEANANSCTVEATWTPPGVAPFVESVLLMVAGEANPKGQVVIIGR